MRRLQGMACGLAAIAVGSLGQIALAKPNDGFSLFGNAEIVKSETQPRKWVAELVSFDFQEIEDFFAGISYEPEAGLVFSDLEELSATYQLAEGGAGGGSPRFSIAVDQDGDGEADGNVFVYLGTPPNFDDEPGGRESTGNLIGSTELRYDSSQVGGTFFDDYEGALELVGDAEVLAVDFVVDGGWATGGVQTVLVSEIQVNDDRFKVNGSVREKSRGRSGR